MTAHGTLRGSITDTGGENADERGFDYDYDSGAPYAHDWTETDSYGVAAFSHQVTGLTEGVTVYFRAKAHNSAGWGYGGELSFVTPKAWSKILSEELALLDTYSRTWSAHKTYSELLGLADIVSKGVVQHPLIEALGLSDTVVKEPGKVLKESLGLLDVYSRTWSVYRTYSEPLGLLDTITKGVSLPLTEILGLLDTYNRTWAIQRTYTEALGLEDRLSKHPSKALVEALGLLDSVSYGKNLSILVQIIRKYLQLEEIEAKEANLNELSILKKIVKLLGEM
ncbi:hypothetical protein ES705_13356 [subsurface metagenome]